MFDTLKRLPTIANLSTTISEKWLIKKAASGDKESFGQLYTKYMNSIYRYIYFKVGFSKFDAEDLTETVFFKAWDKIRNNGFKNSQYGTFRAWLYKIAHNAVIDFYRTQKPQAQLTEDYPLIDYASSPEENTIKNSKIETLTQALKFLTQAEREVVTMKFIDEMKNDEIASQLDKKEEAIRALQYRALKKLKNLLANKQI